MKARQLGLVLALSLFAGIGLPMASSESALRRETAEALGRPLEQLFSRPALHGRAVTGIIVLGGATERTREAVRLASLLPEAKLVITGASKPEHDLALASVKPDRLMFERRARNTYENALFSKELVKPRAGERWLIVTSAIHMPRAMNSFIGLGFQAEPWPVYDVRWNDKGNWAAVQHEWLGLIAYRLTGRSQSLFANLSSPPA